MKNNLLKNAIKRNLGKTGLVLSAFMTMNHATASGVQILGMDDPNRIVGEYIVVFKENVSALSSLTSQNAYVNDLTRNIQHQIGGQVKSKFSHVLQGASMRLADNELKALANHPMVKYIEANKTIHINDTQNNATWGIDRIDQVDLPLDQSYTYNTSADNVHVFILDTGINPNHQEFSGRIGSGIDFVDNDNNPSDCHGHGTHVAGTTAGSIFGVAKGATIHAVRVLDCQGSGSYDGIIDALEWVANTQELPAVANMSLGGSTSQAINDAVRNTVNNGVTVVVAAGNDSSNACNYSPAGEASAITVGSTTSSDKMSSFSNSGTCIDLFAPGSNITSASHSSNSGSTQMSGTSMASPHVAGAAALYLSSNPSATPAEVVEHLTSTAQEGKISDLGYNSPNLLLYVGGDVPPPCDKDCPPPPPPPSDEELQEGTPLNNLSDDKGGQVEYVFLPKSDATSAKITMSGGNGDADLYVKVGSKPTLNSYDCRPYKNGNNETCEVEVGTNSTVHVMVHAYSSYSSVSLLAESKTSDNGGSCDNIPAWSPSQFYYSGDQVSYKGNAYYAQYSNYNQNPENNGYFKYWILEGSCR